MFTGKIIKCGLDTQTVKKVVPVKRNKQFDRITANELCQQAGLDPKY